MFKRIVRYLKRTDAFNRINLALNRGSVTASLRTIDPSQPSSWEFSSFSQHGEDGIIDFLTRKINNPDHSFIEIGAADGLENNTAFLAIARKYQGLMVEGKTRSVCKCQQIITDLSLLGVESAHLFVEKDNIDQLNKLVRAKDPDVFSLDIDGNDYHIMQALLETGYLPKICVVEYNAVFGPEQAITIPYEPNFNYLKSHDSHLYFGSSIAAWKELFERHGYLFVSVDQSGTNAFFIHPQCFDPKFSKNIQGLGYKESFFQVKKFNQPWEKRFDLIKHLSFVEMK